MSSIKERYKLAWEQRYTPKSRLRTKRKQGWSEIENIKTDCEANIGKFQGLLYFPGRAHHYISPIRRKASRNFSQTFLFLFLFHRLQDYCWRGWGRWGRGGRGLAFGHGWVYHQMRGRCRYGPVLLGYSHRSKLHMRNLWTLWHCASFCLRFLYLKMSKKKQQKKRQNSYRQYANEEQVFPSVYRSD